MKADIRANADGVSETEIAGRQSGRLRQLSTAMQKAEPGQQIPGLRNRRNFPRDVGRRLEDYRSSFEEISRNNNYNPDDCPFLGECKANKFLNQEMDYYYSRDKALEAERLYFDGKIDNRWRYRDLAYSGQAQDPLLTGNVGLMKSFGWMAAVTFIVIVFLSLVSAVRGQIKYRKKKEMDIQDQFSLSNYMFTRQFGLTKSEIIHNVSKLFEERKSSIGLDLNWIGRSAKTKIKCSMSRSLATMTSRERWALRSAILLRVEGLNVSEYNTWSQILGIFFGDGKATIFGGGTYVGFENFSRDVGSPAKKIEWLIGDDKVDSCITIIMKELSEAVAKNPENTTVREIASHLLGNGENIGSGSFLKKSTSVDDKNGLIIGHDESGSAGLLKFGGEGSLITVAPPGSGKTQCHVIPNLLTWPGPAVVLDIKGEIYEATSGWRRSNVGPVFRFSPLDPGNSHSYNPLLAVSDDPDHIWEDSRFLADMLIVPGGKSKDSFWESRARDVLTAAIAATVRDNPPELRGMGKVLDILHGVGWTDFLMALAVAADVPSMTRSGRSLGEMDAKMRDSVLQTALASLSVWEGARIARATSKSDWSPLDLRSDQNPTIYICISPNQIDSYASMLRVIIAQHIRALTSHLPGRKGHPILFILDELPRLRHMPPVEEALEIGRQYGIKLWMFTQSLGQMETAYENAEGMVGSCAVRMFMNASLHDGTAQKLSDDMGFRESVIDGTRVKRVEANVLAGPEFADKVIVMASGAEPARVRKHYAYKDPELSRRMKIPSPGTEE